MKFSTADGKLASLSYRDYDLIDLVNIGKSVDNFKTSTLDAMEPAQAYDQNNDLVSIKSLKVCLKYQRKMRLKKAVNKLKLANGFKKEAAGHIDVAIRPDGTMYIWDGFRRAFMAGLVGLEHIPASIYRHQSNLTIKECEEYEAKMFKIRNADNEKMKVEEIFRSKIIYRDPEAIKFLDFLVECNLDVEKLNEGKRELSGMNHIYDRWKNESITHENMILSSNLIQSVWKNDPTISGYLMSGLAKFLDANDEIDGSYDIQEIVEKLRKFVNTNPMKQQNELTNRRLNSAASQSVAYCFATQVMEMTGENLKNLVSYLKLDTNDLDLIESN